MAEPVSVAVVDATLLGRLAFLDRVADRLPLLFARVHVPRAVRAEVASKPDWGPGMASLFAEMAGFFVDCDVGDPLVIEVFRVELDAGEAEALAQAAELQTAGVKVEVLIDELRGTKVAHGLRFEVVRTGRLLIRLKEAGAIEHVEPHLDQLIEHGFRLAPADRAAILRAAGEAKDQPGEETRPT